MIANKFSNERNRFVTMYVPNENNYLIRSLCKAITNTDLRNKRRQACLYFEILCKLSRRRGLKTFLRYCAN